MPLRCPPTLRGAREFRREPAIPMKISRRVAALEPSATLAITALANKLKAEGKDVIGFGAGEPDFDTPDHIKAAAHRALDQGFTKYTPSAGINELRAAIAAKITRDTGTGYAAADVMVSNGGKQCLYNLCQTLLDDGDEAIVIAPYWVSYPEMIKAAGARPVFLETAKAEGFRPDPAKLDRLIGPATRMVILNSPSNPTGLGLDARALGEIAAVLLKHPHVTVVSDEIYEYIVYGGFQHRSIVAVEPALKARAFIVNGASKSYAMTGWRVGYVAGPAEVIGWMTRLQDQSTSGICSIAQKAALAAFAGPQDCLKPMLDAFTERRQVIVEGLNTIPGVTCAWPEGAFYAFPDVSALCAKRYKGEVLGGSARFAAALLEAQLVAAVHGEPFGAEGFVRLSYATSMANIREGLKRIAAFAASLT